jgi:hypothetical protein
VKVGGTCGLLPKLLYHRQIILQRNATYKSLDGFGLAAAGSCWKLLKPAAAERQ